MLLQRLLRLAHREGREIFESAVWDPQTLADCQDLVAGGDASDPAFWSLPWRVHHERTGGDFPDSGSAGPTEPAGEKFDESDEGLRERLPRLFEAFWEED